jgi:phosphate transport system substrate-binding protein
MKYTIIILILYAATLDASTQRIQIRRVGSSTIQPFTQEVVNAFDKQTKYIKPLITTNGSGAGIKEFCAGIDPLTPDQADASRAMSQKELETCFKNGVTEITKLTIGRNGLCFLHSQKALTDQKINTISLTPMQIFLAIIKDVPTQNGNLIPNANRVWSDIDPTLPNAPIKVRIPPTWHGTRGDFELMVLEPNCETFPWVKDLKTKDPKKYAKICHSLREDNQVLTMQDYELAENADVLVDNLATSELGEIGIVGCNINKLHAKSHRVKALAVNKIAPSPVTLKDGSYPLVYSLQIYFKNAHFGIVQGMQEFIKFYSAPNIIGPGGLLSKYGIVPVDSSENPIIEITPKNPVT